MNRENRIYGQALRVALLASVAFVGVGWSAVAQEEEENASQDVQEFATEEEQEQIIIYGVRRSLETALENKRNAETIIDGISAEGIGRFPDLNLAESLQRITGVQIDRGDRREGEIAIRGLPNRFSLTTFNGQRLASPDFDTGFTFGVFESDVVSAVNVIKTPLVSMDEGGLSGVVDIKTRRPLSIEDDFIALSVEADYEGLQRAIVPSAGISVGKKFGGDKAAFIASFSWTDQNFRRDTVRVTSYAGEDRDGDDLDDLFTPRDFRALSRDNQGYRISATAGIELAPSDNWNFGLLGVYSDRSLDNALDQIRVRNIDETIALNTVTNAEFGDTVTQINALGPRVESESRIFEDEFRTLAVTGDATWQNDDWSVKTTLHYTRGDRERFAIQSRRRIDSSADELTVFLNQGAGNLSDFTITGMPDFNNEQIWSIANDNTRTLFIPSTGIDRKDDEFAVQLDVSKTIDRYGFTSLDVGGKYRDIQRDQTRPSFSTSGLDFSQIDDLGVLRESFLNDSNAFGGALPGVTGFFVADWKEVRDDILGASTITGATFGGFPITISESTQFESSVEVFAAYAMAKFDLSTFGNGWPIRGNAGIRYVNTKRATEAFRRGDFLPESELITADTQFDHVLPAINFIVDIRENLVFRVSRAKTIVRPNVNQFRAGQRIDADFDSETGALEDLTIEIGNPDILPFEANSLDFSLEWYNRQGSAVTIAYFRKKVRNGFDPNRLCPASLNDIEEIADLDFSGVVTGPLTEEGGVCSDANGAQIIITETLNNSDSFTISGFEIGILQNFDFLDGFWSNFGIQANYTYIDADESGNLDASGNPLPLENVSKHTFNLIGYYETERIGIRLAHNFRDDYFVVSTGTFGGEDRIRKGTHQLDFSASYNVTSNFTLSFEAFNLLNAKRIEFQGVEERFRAGDFDGRTYTLGARYRF